MHDIHQEKPVRSHPLTAGVLFILALLCPGPAGAGSVKIVAVRSGPLAPYDDAIRGFEKGLSAKGIQAEIKTITLPGDPAGDQAMATDLDRQAPSVVLAVGASAAKLCRLNVKSAPVLFCMVMEPEEFGYGGVSMALPLADNLELITRSVPQFKRVGVIYNPARSASLIREIQALDKKGALVAAAAGSPAEVDRAVTSLKGKIDVLLLLPDPVIFPVQTLGVFLAQCIKGDLPIVGASLSYVKAGAIASFFANYENNGEVAAGTAARLLKGENIKAIPILPPTKVDSSFNLLIAHHMERNVSDEAIKGASNVIQ